MILAFLGRVVRKAVKRVSKVLVRGAISAVGALVSGLVTAFFDTFADAVCGESSASFARA